MCRLLSMICAGFASRQVPVCWLKSLLSKRLDVARYLQTTRSMCEHWHALLESPNLELASCRLQLCYTIPHPDISLSDGGYRRELYQDIRMTCLYWTSTHSHICFQQSSLHGLGESAGACRIEAWPFGCKSVFAQELWFPGRGDTWEGHKIREDCHPKSWRRFIYYNSARHVLEEDVRKLREALWKTTRKLQWQNFTRRPSCWNPRIRIIARKC